MSILRKIAVALLLTAAVRAQTCGGTGQNATCGALGPCCSEFQFCGATPAQCGGGCQPEFSGKDACLASRTGGKKCISGYYKFDNGTWIVPSDAYNGNPQTADFTIDRAGLIAGNFRSGVTGKFAATVSPPPAGKPDGLGVRLSTTSYLTPGSTATIRMKPAVGGGVVTAFITMADDKDEIDWEITGDPALLGVGQSNFFSKGLIDYTNGGKHWPGSGRTPPAAKGANLQNEFHEYGISWQADKIVWLIDKEVVRTTTAAQLGAKFPTSNPRIQFAVWDGGFGTDEASKGRRDWAGGNINFSADNSTRTAQVEWIKIQCGGEPEPTDAPKRPAGWYRPYIYANGIQSVVPGVFGYDATYTGSDKISLANVMTELIENPTKPVKNATSNQTLTIVDGQVVPVGKGNSKNDAPSAFAAKSFGVVFSILFAVLFC